jgi:predicted nucleic acid-binding protein
VIVISDNSALSALAETGLLELLPRLLGEVSIPDAVRREWLDFEETISSIRQTGFHLSDAVVAEARKTLGL